IAVAAVLDRSAQAAKATMMRWRRGTVASGARTGCIGGLRTLGDPLAHGVDLSGGEWISRGHLRPDPGVALDADLGVERRVVGVARGDGHEAAGTRPRQHPGQVVEAQAAR